jgi:hypothetical protein
LALLRKSIKRLYSSGSEEYKPGVCSLKREKQRKVSHISFNDPFIMQNS